MRREPNLSSLSPSDTAKADVMLDIYFTLLESRQFIDSLVTLALDVQVVICVSRDVPPVSRRERGRVDEVKDEGWEGKTRRRTRR